jgi:hypothetical protein
MKKILLIFLALALLLSLFACGKNNKEDIQNTTSGEITTVAEGDSEGVQESDSEADGTVGENILSGEEMTLDEVPLEED